MSRSPALWATAVAISLATHGLLFAFLGLSVDPDLVDPQPMPQSQLNVSAYEVKRSQAPESQAIGEPAEAGEADSAAASQAVVPSSTATETKPVGIRAQAAPLADVTAVAVPAAARAQDLSERPAPAVKLAAISASAPVLAAVTAAPVPADLAQAPAEALSAAVASAETLAALPSEPAPALSPVSARVPVTPAVAAAPVPAELAQAPAEVLNAATASAEVLAALPSEPAPALSPVSARVPVTPAFTATPAETLIAVAASRPVVAALPTQPSLALASVDPERPVLAALQSPADTLPQAEAQPQALDQIAAPNQPLPQSPTGELANPIAAGALPAEFATAALAWSGAEAGDTVDPVSIAAIQAFLRPGDLSSTDANAGNVRDGISILLASVPCARLQAAFVPETGALELRGHVPEEELRAPILAALQAQVGADMPVRDNMLILPRPQCGALSGISAVGLPQSTDQLTNPLLVGADAHAREYRYAEGDRLTFDLTAPDYDGFVYVDYFDADGMVIHLVPNEVVPLEHQIAESIVAVGVERADAPSLNITIGPPFGQEIAVAFAASSRLYDGLRPITEPADAYLEFLQARVSEARARDADFKGEWVYFFISTAPGTQ